ncbi:MAG: PPC domain-containing protein [Planctomycetaceae bacterium]|nr:PPC domain-containing protein [Planctomycetaceae bacterium]
MSGRPVCLVFFAALISVSAVADEKPPFCIFPYSCPTAGRIDPPVGQRGATHKALLLGARLQQIEEFLFYDAGIEVIAHRPVAQIPHDIHGDLRPTPAGTAVELTLKIADDCRVGEHFFRLRTHEALSEMLSFWVTPFPCIKEHHWAHDRTANGGNGRPDLAQPVKRDVTVIGYHPAYATMDHDFYAVELQQGERLTVEVWSACLGFHFHGGLTDCAITVYDPDQKKLAYCDDTSLRDMDPIVSLTAPRTGTYYVNIHQNMDYEGKLRPYAAHFSAARRPMITYPLGGQAGTTVPLQLIEADGTHTSAQQPLPATPGVFEQSMMDYRPTGAVIANRLQVASFANVLEDGGDHFQPEQAQVYDGELPIAFNGRIEHEGKTDWFRFSAKQGTRYRVRTYAATLGSSLDARLWIRPAEGTSSRVQIEADDSRWVDHDWHGNDKVGFIRDRMDPVAIFEPDTDGDYLIGIADAQRLFGADFVYRVEIQPHTDQAFVYFPTDYRESAHKRDRLVIHRGNTTEHILGILPGVGNRYRGGIEIYATGLPDGVTFSCPPLAPGQTLTQATLTASANAEPWAGLVELKLRPTDPAASFTGSFVHNVPSTTRRGGYNVVYNRSRRCALAVVEEAPFQVSVQTPSIPLAANALLDLEVFVKRREGFDKAIRVYAAWTPPDVATPGPVVIPPGESRGVFRLKANSRVKPGRYVLSLTAQEDSGGYRSWGTGYHFVASPPIPLEISAPYLELAFDRAAIERRQSGQITATVKVIRELPGNATATLVRLPTGVELVRPATIRPGDNQVTFEIRATSDALTGQYQQIGCQITISAQGQKIVQESGSGILRIDQERNRR